jgi:gas vesicle protein
MKEITMNTKGSATMAFVVGAVAGGVTALLLAPQSGEQLRRRIKKETGELKTARARLSDRLDKATRDRTGAIVGAVTEAKSSYKEELDRRRNLDNVDAVARKTGA